MKPTSKSVRRAAVALALVLATAVSAGPPYELVAPATESGGGAIAGGPYTAITSIVTADTASILEGGAYEVTGGVERRRLDARSDALFGDGYE